MTPFFLALGVIFLTAAASGSIAGRLKLPRVVGEMGAGLILGQSLLGHAWPRAENYLFGPNVLGTLKPTGLLIVLLYVALVGAELDRSALRGQSRGLAVAIVIGLAAAVAGAVAIGTTLTDLEPGGVPRWTYFVFLTGALLVTAVPVLARILDETGLTNTRVGTIVLTLSIADDFVAFSLIAIAIAVSTHGSLALAVGGTALLAALVVAVKAARGTRRWLAERRTPDVSVISIGLLAVAAAATEALGASTLVAAFLVGGIFWRTATPDVPLRGGALIRALVPLYIVYAALSVDVERLAVPRLAVAVVLTMLVAVVTKSIASLAAGRLLSLDRNESISLAVLRNTRGLTELVALNLGYEAGILPQDLYTVFFVMAILTTAASGAVAMAALRPLEQALERALERRHGVTARDEPLPG